MTCNSLKSFKNLDKWPSNRLVKIYELLHKINLSLLLQPRTNCANFQHTFSLQIYPDACTYTSRGAITFDEIEPYYTFSREEDRTTALLFLRVLVILPELRSRPLFHRD